MKRFLAYMLLVLGLGLVFSVNANAKGVCVQIVSSAYYSSLQKIERILTTPFKNLRVEHAKWIKRSYCEKSTITYDIRFYIDKKQRPELYKKLKKAFAKKSSCNYRKKNTFKDINDPLNKSYFDCAHGGERTDLNSHPELIKLYEQKTQIAKKEPLKTQELKNVIVCVPINKKRSSYTPIGSVPCSRGYNATTQKQIVKKTSRLIQSQQIVKKEPTQTQQLDKTELKINPKDQELINKYSYDKEFYCFQNLKGTFFLGSSKAGWVTTTDNIENLCDYLIYKEYHPKIYRTFGNFEKYNFSSGEKFPVADIYVRKLNKKKYSKVLHKKTILKQTQIAKTEPTQTQQLDKAELKINPKDQELINKFANYEKNCVPIEKIELFNKKTKKINKPSKGKICIKITDVIDLGEFKEIQSFPEGMLSGTLKTANWTTIFKKAGSEVYTLFVRRTPIYHARKPGAMIFGMSWYEIFYLGQLKKNTKVINRFISNDPESYSKFNSDVKKINSLIKMNEGRIKMREALGFTKDDRVEDVIKGEWLLGTFLNNDKLKVKKVALSSDLKKRKILLARYKSAIGAYKKKLKEKIN